MGYLAAFPVLGLSLMLQLAVFSRLPLLHGTADLVLLVLVCWALQDRVKSHWFWTLLAGGMVTLASGLPFYTRFLGIWQGLGWPRLLHRQCGNPICKFPLRFNLGLSWGCHWQPWKLPA